MSNRERPTPSDQRDSAGAPLPLSAPLYLSSVWICEDPDQAEALLEGAGHGYVYRRDGHPNADRLLEKCRQLHRADMAALASSGMAAWALAVLSQLQQEDHIIVSDQLYGRSLHLLGTEISRQGIRCTMVDTSDLAAVESAVTGHTRWIVAETVSNPLLRVADIRALADVAHRHHAHLVIDNTFATPLLCRPLELGADLVLESLTKLMNGHSDVVLGLLCGRQELWERVPATLSTWGLTSAPLDCWLAERGLATLELRVQHTAASALEIASFLQQRPEVQRVDYPGLPEHPDYALARRQFGDRFGSIVTFHLHGGRAAATALLRATAGIAFCPSLGEATTTWSHPESTSHRGLSAAARQRLGVSGGTIRLSVGLEGVADTIQRLEQGLNSVSHR